MRAHRGDRLLAEGQPRAQHGAGVAEHRERLQAATVDVLGRQVAGERVVGRLDDDLAVLGGIERPDTGQGAPGVAVGRADDDDHLTVAGARQQVVGVVADRVHELVARDAGAHTCVLVDPRR